MKKNILVLTESMRPFTSEWGSCQRVYYYSKALIEDGYGVSIICKNNSEQEKGLYYFDGIKVISFDEPNINKENNAQKSSFKERLVKFIKSKKIIHSILKFVYRLLYSEPNLFRGHESKKWANNNKKKIIEYIKNNDVQTVIVSGPPFGLFYLVSSLKKNKVKIVLDYRDPWNLWYGKFSFSNRHEKKAIRFADVVVSSTNELAKAIKINYKKNDSISVLNGYDEERWKNIKKNKEDSDSFVVSYIGTIRINNSPDFRNPTVLLEASKEFLTRHNDAVVRIIGVGDDLEQMGKNEIDRLFFEKQVSVEESLKYTVNSDLLLVLHTAHDDSGNYIVCGKIYDYLRSKNRILSIGDKAECNKNLIESSKCGLHVKNNFDSILNGLEREYERWKKRELDNCCTFEITKYSRQFQNKLFVSYLNQMLGEKRND